MPALLLYQAYGPSPSVKCCAAKYPRIDLIASDVDGTLLTHRQTLTSRVETAIKLAAAAGVPVSLQLRHDL